MITKDGFLTRSELTRQMKEVVASIHHLSVHSIKVEWLSTWGKRKYPTGLVCKAGMIKLFAPSFQTVTKFVSQKRNERWTIS